MSNEEAQGYAVVALASLIDAGHIKADKKDLCKMLDSEMCYLMDRFYESEIKAKAAKIFQGE